MGPNDTDRYDGQDEEIEDMLEEDPDDIEEDIEDEDIDAEEENVLRDIPIMEDGVTSWGLQYHWEYPDEALIIIDDAEYPLSELPSDMASSLLDREVAELRELEVRIDKMYDDVANFIRVSVFDNAPDILLDIFSSDERWATVRPEDLPQVIEDTGAIVEIKNAVIEEMGIDDDDLNEDLLDDILAHASDCAASLHKAWINEYYMDRSDEDGEEENEDVSVC